MKSIGNTQNKNIMSSAVAAQHLKAFNKSLIPDNILRPVVAKRGTSNAEFRLFLHKPVSGKTQAFMPYLVREY